MCNLVELLCVARDVCGIGHTRVHSVPLHDSMSRAATPSMGPSWHHMSHVDSVTDSHVAVGQQKGGW